MATIGHGGPPRGPGGDPSGADRRLDAAMARWADGDDHAFSDLHSDLHPYFLRLARKVVAPDDAADLAQSAFLKLCRARGTYIPGSPVRRWARTILLNCCKDHQRRVRRRISTDGAVDLDGLDGRVPTPEQYAAAAQLDQKLLCVLQAISVIDREAYVLVVENEMSVKDAAEYVAASSNVLKFRLFRARQVLRAWLGPYFDGDV